MRVSAWWRSWQAEIRRRKAIDKLPARFAPSFVVVSTFIGRFLAGVSGVSAAVSISVVISSYTSLSTVDLEHICVASRFVSRTVQEGQTAALEFLFAGVLAVVAAAFPRSVWVVQNARLHDQWNEKLQPHPFESWAVGFSEQRVVILFLLFQIIPLFISFGLTIKGFDHAFGAHSKLSPEAIQSMWREFKVACSH